MKRMDRMETMGKVETPYDALTYKIIGLAMDIHNEIGPGFSEEIYQRAMVVALEGEGTAHEQEYLVRVFFRGKAVGEFKLDFVVERLVVVEFKALTALAPVHEQQVIAYLAASGLPIGLLINFGASKLEYKRLFPPRAVQSSKAYQSRKIQR